MISSKSSSSTKSAGRVICSTDKRLEGEYRLGDQYFIEGQKGSYVQNVYPSPVTGQPTMTISTPLWDQGETRLLGVLAAHLNLEIMDEIIQTGPELPGQIESYAVDKFNVFVSAKRFGREKFPRGVHTLGIDAAVRGGEGRSLYQNHDQVPVIGVYGWVKELELALVVEMPQRQAFGPARRLAFSLFGVGVLCAGIIASAMDGIVTVDEE